MTYLADSKRCGTLSALLGTFVLATAGIATAQAQTPGAFVTIASSDQPVPGPGQDPTLARDDQTLWSRSPGAAASNGAGWSFIKLVDLNGDGLDDLCGVYGLSNGQHVYGCVLNNGNRNFSGTIRQVQAFNGTPNPSIHSTITMVDLGDGWNHLCGRTVEGMKCQRFNGSTFDAPEALFPSHPEVDFSDANFWNQEEYYSTIGFARLSGKVALCGRGIDGVMCFLRIGGAFDPRRFLQSAFGNGSGWSAPEYYRTIRYVDVDGDGNTDICARGIGGIICSVWRQTPISHFESPVVMTTQFSDAWGWYDARYYPSIRFGDVNADGSLDVCGRGFQGLYCGVTRSTQSAAPSFVHPFGNDVNTLVQTEMSNVAHWGDSSSNLRSFFITDFDHDGKNDVCGLNSPSGGFPDLFCARSHSTATGAGFDPLVVRTRNVNTSERVAVGHLYPGGGIGFCWTLLDRSVNCSVQWH